VAWEIEENLDGTFDVRHDRRPVRYDEDTLEDAIGEVRRGGGIEFVLIETDGYRTTHPT
jgi:hypothetical protein